MKFRVFSMSELEEKSQLHAPDDCTFNQIVIPVLEHDIIKMCREKEEKIHAFINEGRSDFFHRHIQG